MNNYFNFFYLPFILDVRKSLFLKYPATFSEPRRPILKVKKDIR